MTIHTVLFKVGIREEIIKSEKNERKKEMPKTKTTRQIVAVLCISFCADPRGDGRPACADSDHFSEFFYFH